MVTASSRAYTVHNLVEFQRRDPRLTGMYRPNAASVAVEQTHLSTATVSWEAAMVGHLMRQRRLY